MPPQVNATLTRVAGATAATGGRDDWDEPAGQEPAGAGAQKWTGAEEAYLREKVERIRDGQTVTNVTVRTLIIDTSVYRAIGIDTDDVVTYTGPDGEEQSSTCEAIAASELAGIPLALQTTRLELADR